MSSALVMLLSPTLAQADPALYVCDGAGDNQFIIRPVRNTDLAEVISVPGLDSGSKEAEVFLFKGAKTDTGYRYAGEGLELRLDGDSASLSGSEGFTSVCEAFEPVGPATKGAAVGEQVTGLPVQALSLGGALRSGPGMEFDRMGSLAGRTEVTLLENTGVMMNGYAWFRLEANGATAFQWGGLICSPKTQVAGVYEVCQ